MFLVMEKYNKDSLDNQVADESADNYPGAAVNIADDCKVDSEMVKEDVKNLNNNPRSND